jgi:hypothetical protein
MVITPEVTVYMPPRENGDSRCLHWEGGVVLSEVNGAVWVNHHSVAPTIAGFLDIARRYWDIMKQL